MPDITVGVYDAKTRLAKLLMQVENGDCVTITRHGKAVARIVPIEGKPDLSREEAVEALRTFAKGRTLNGLSIREMINEGRR